MGALLELETAVAELKGESPAGFAVPGFKLIPYGYRLGWGLASSIILHEIAFFLILFFSIISSPFVQPPLEKLADAQITQLNGVVYLPSVGGGSEGSGHAAGGRDASLEDYAAAPARSSQGFSYPGSQPIISDPPRAFNPSQTILHPAMNNLPILQKFVPLPNIVQMANSAPALPRTVTAVRPAMPSVPLPEIAQIRARKLTLPAGDTVYLPVLANQHPQTEIKKLSEQPSVPAAVDVSDLPLKGSDAHTMLALSPIPAPPTLPLDLPGGEARGRFAISPQPTVATPEPGPGSRSGGTAAFGAGIGNRADLAANAASNSVNSIVAGSAAGSGGNGRDIASGDSGTDGSGSGAGGAGHGSGAGTGAGIGQGSGSASGSGSGAGSGPGHGGFPGITIQGGRYGGSAELRARLPAQRQTSYGMTIVSNAGSGGGLPDFGVFAHEKVYTVYVDMRARPQGPAPKWTLQYAPTQQSSSAAPLTGLTPPFVERKDMPHFPLDLLRRYAHKLMVVSAVMTTDGKMQQVVVRQSPDPGLSDVLLETLRSWVFRPAELDGKPIAIKLLLGIPLSVPQ